MIEALIAMPLELFDGGGIAEFRAGRFKIFYEFRIGKQSHKRSRAHDASSIDIALIMGADDHTRLSVFKSAFEYLGGTSRINVGKDQSDTPSYGSMPRRV